MTRTRTGPVHLPWQWRCVLLRRAPRRVPRVVPRMGLLRMLLLPMALLGWVLMGLVQAAEPLPAAAPVQLAATESDVDAWRAVRILADPDHAMGPEQALAALARFQPPGGRLANLGRRSETVWMHLVLQPAEAGWWLAMDYPSLDAVEVFLLREGRVVQRSLTGDHLPPQRRGTAARLPLVELALQPGERHELLLRVRTTSSMIVPLRFMRGEALLRYDGTVQAAQGLLMGLGLSMMVYALVVGLLLRDLTFLWFALATAASTLFFAAYYGMAPLYLWPGSEWLTRNAAPLMMLLLLASGTMFVNRSLDLPLQSPRASWLMRGIALVAVLAAVLFAAGGLGYRGASAVSSYLGLMPMVISLPLAFRRALVGGDTAARLTFVGWLLYAAGVVVLAGLQSGQLRFNAWTHYALQAASMVQLLAWVLILAARAANQRRQAALARREHERLRMIAQTDPLTGLLNRRGLAQALGTLLPAAHPSALVAVYVIDLDAFKPVNDTHGHDAGDELLVQMAGRLKRAVRSADLVARTGGDEFVVVAGQLKAAPEADQIGHKLLACSDSEFALSAARCSIGMTIGYALAPTDGLDPDQLIKRADAAMYEGKQAGRRRIARAGLAPA